MWTKRNLLAMPPSVRDPLALAFLPPQPPYSVCFCVSYTGIYVIRQPRYADLFSCTSQANNTWSLVREARDDSWSV